MVNISNLCRQLKLQASDLDELVYEAAMQGLARLNEVSTFKAQNAIIEDGEDRASRINNEGLQVQIKFLGDAWGFPEVERQIKNLKHEAIV